MFLLFTRKSADIEPIVQKRQDNMHITIMAGMTENFYQFIYWQNQRIVATVEKSMNNNHVTCMGSMKK